MADVRVFLIAGIVLGALCVPSCTASPVVQPVPRVRPSHRATPKGQMQGHVGAAGQHAYQPGSWLQVGSWSAPNYTGPTVTFTLYSGSTGNNYTTYLPVEAQTLSGLTLSRKSRVAMVTWYTKANQSEIMLSVYNYAAEAPPRLNFTCSLGSPGVWYEAGLMYIAGRYLAVAGKSLWEITPPTASTPSQCVATPIGMSLSIEYSPPCTLVVDDASARAWYLSGGWLVTLIALDTPEAFGTLVTGPPAGAQGARLVMGYDVTRRTLLLDTTTQDYNTSFWVGHVHGPHVNWQQSTYWKNGMAPGSYFHADTRYESQANGTLLCSTDSSSLSYCWTLQAQLWWKGPRLEGGYVGTGSGATSNMLYDPDCHL